MSATLYQLRSDGLKTLISFASAKFSPVELRYELPERDSLAEVWAYRRYEGYLSTERFYLKTKSKALDWLNRSKDIKRKLGR